MDLTIKTTEEAYNSILMEVNGATSIKYKLQEASRRLARAIDDSDPIQTKVALMEVNLYVEAYQKRIDQIMEKAHNAYDDTGIEHFIQI